MENTPVEATSAASSGGNLLSPDLVMVVLTWATFFVLLAILKKYAWKPILQNLKDREDFIRKSLTDADNARLQLTQIEGQKQEMLNAAKGQAAHIIDEARKTAASLALDTQNKAKASAQDLIRNAQIQIDGECQKVRQALQVESVNAAIILAGKILKENTDTEKNRRLVEEAVKEI